MLLAICVRIVGNGLITAECEALTGGRPDSDGVAECESIDRIRRAAYVQHGVRVIASAPTFDELRDAVAVATFDADRFRIDVHDPSDRLGMADTEVAIALADVMAFGPDLKAPQHRFLVVASESMLKFGEIVTSSDASYRVHDDKPWTTSSSLDSRFARALVNLVPDARSILDPCCGAGSIVLEAASLGIEAHGVDWKQAMVGMTGKNLEAFGHTGDVVRDDARTIERVVDAVVTDLPYGHAIVSDDDVVRAILANGARCAPIGVFVTSADITEWLLAAGYSAVTTSQVTKRRHLTRWVHVASQ